jgi:AraC-like DNA-binding protein
MNHEKKKITLILLVAILASSLVALFLLPYRWLSAILFGISASGLFVYYIFSINNHALEIVGKNYYSDYLITDELDRFFRKNKPYLNASYKISDLEKQLKVSRSAISSFTKQRFGRNFNQFLNLWRIAELRHLQSLPENRNTGITSLCLQAGFDNAQQYYQAEKERKAINRRKNKNKLAIKKAEDRIINDPDIKQKPGVHLRI